jgi:hypothetical protein
MRPFLSAAAALMLAFAALLQVSARADAASFSPFAIKTEPGLVQKVGSGCGWDYPCPPRAYNGRPAIIHKSFQRARTQFNIENYGDVHINYYDKHRVHGHARDYPDYPYRHQRGRHCYARDCGDSCGPHCWYRRFKSGYCGHGCDYYREKVHFEPEYREVKVYRPHYYKEPIDKFREGHFFPGGDDSSGCDSDRCDD